MARIETQQVRIRLSGTPEEAVLLLRDGELLALVRRLDPAGYVNDPDIAGKWTVELGFGACAVGNRTVLFETLDEAIGWADQRSRF